MHMIIEHAVLRILRLLDGAALSQAGQAQPRFSVDFAQVNAYVRYLMRWTHLKSHILWLMGGSLLDKP